MGVENHFDRTKFYIQFPEYLKSREEMRRIVEESIGISAIGKVINYVSDFYRRVFCKPTAKELEGRLNY